MLPSFSIYNPINTPIADTIHSGYPSNRNLESKSKFSNIINVTCLNNRSFNCFTASLTHLRISIFNVVLSGSNPKMFRVHTQSIITRVTNTFSFLYGAFKYPISESMGWLYTVIAISPNIFSTSPNPTRFSFVDKRNEPIDFDFKIEFIPMFD